MRRFGFLVSRRWALFFLAVLGLAWVAWQLGQWQFHRLEDRQERNAIVERNEGLPPAPVQEVLAVGDPVERAEEWRLVTARGTYAVEDTVVVRYRTRDGVSGVDVLVPLELSDGTSVLVDRGWMATQSRGEVPDDVPAPPEGEVTVTGYVRADGSGDSTVVTDRSTRAVNSSRVAEALDRELVGGFVDLRSEDPEPETPLAAPELPELDDGPHFFYGLQWWFFGALAIFGFFYLMYDEWRDARAGSQRPQRPAVDREHDAADV